jgi:hypothetical protein
LDHSKILGKPIDQREAHRVSKAVSRNVGVLKGLDGKLSSINLRTLAQQIKIKVNNLEKATPLASGSVMLEFISNEAYVKALNIGIIDIAGIRTKVASLPGEKIDKN